MAEKPNGMYGEVAGEDADESFNGSSRGPHQRERERERERETLYGVLHRLITSIIFPAPDNAATMLNRIKISVSQNVPLIPEASKNTGRDVLLWTRRGSPLRALLVISVGTITCVALTGLLVFALFFLAATINAIVISLLMSLAAAGGFLALFFAFVTVIYIGALSVAIFTISTVTFWTIVAILITTDNGDRLTSQDICHRPDYLFTLFFL
ncbi:uncharacterized protein LOC114722375 isoform X2 [Neltuma alba]|uniref:uncharacterized protein LOC114722375 isoform X2 n=1 Tax=Neltuma alba TaxID=207710 RepID=UPI0010A529D0|nr:uncharacterized protein LOC114722375 isoform X2 [Prosopis alba]